METARLWTPAGSLRCALGNPDTAPYPDGVNPSTLPPLPQQAVRTRNNSTTERQRITARQVRKVIAGPIPEHAFPAFPDLECGWFSLPLNSPYLPIGKCVQFNTFVAGEVPIDEIPMLVATAFHEQDGHQRLQSNSRKLIQLGALLSWGALSEIMKKGTAVPTELLEEADSSRRCAQLFNSWSKDGTEQTISDNLEGLRNGSLLISKVARSISLPEELHATIVGFWRARWQPEVSAGALESMKQACLAYYAAEERLGSVFADLFERIWQIADPQPAARDLEPLTLIMRYAADAIAEDENGVRLDWFPDEVVKERLEKGLSVLLDISRPGKAWSDLPVRDWQRALAARIPDLALWEDSTTKVDAMLSWRIARQVDWWDSTGMKDANPAQAMVLLHGVGGVNIQMDNVETPGLLAFSLLQEHAVEDRLAPAIFEKCLLAHEQGRVVVAIRPGAGARAVFLPFEVGGEVMPFPYLSLVMPPDGPMGGPVSQDTYHKFYGHLKSLLFFESVRTMYVEGRGVRCPLLFGMACPGGTQFGGPAEAIPGTDALAISPGHCCGWSDALCRVYLAGVLDAVRNGVWFTQWRAVLDEGCVDRLREARPTDEP